MAEPPVVRPLSEVVADSIRGFRSDLEMSQAELADAMSRYGFNWTPITVAEIEGKRRRRVSVEELLGLAIVFDTAVAHFLIPLQLGNLRPLLELSPRISLPPSELIRLLGLSIRPSPMNQEQGRGLVADLLRLRRDRDLRVRQADDAQSRLEMLTASHAEALKAVFRHRRQVDEITSRIVDLERRLSEEQDSASEYNLVQYQGLPPIGAGGPEQASAGSDGDRFRYVVERVVAEEIGAPLEDVTRMSLWLWRGPARDEVNRRLESEEEFALRREDSWAEMSLQVAHELRQAVIRDTGSEIFYVYENWTNTFARVHQADCSYCNHGQGDQGRGSKTANGQWLGPFNSMNDAMTAAHDAAEKYSNREVWTVAVCGHCG